MINKLTKGLLATTLFCAIGLSASAADGNYKFAVVDVNAVVEKAPQVQALKQTHKKKTEELYNWVKVAREDVEKQKTKEGKDKLYKKYDAEFNKKQEALQKEYTAKLKAIDENITSIIAKEAKAKGYDMIFVKSTVLFGGEDITQSIIKSLK